jgi:hypothetical protein
LSVKFPEGVHLLSLTIEMCNRHATRENLGNFLILLQNTKYFLNGVFLPVYNKSCGKLAGFIKTGQPSGIETILQQKLWVQPRL